MMLILMILFHFMSFFLGKFRFLQFVLVLEFSFLLLMFSMGFVNEGCFSIVIFLCGFFVMESCLAIGILVFFKRLSKKSMILI